MNAACCFALLLLVRALGAEAGPDLQSLKRLLEEALHTPDGSSEELRAGHGDGNTGKSVFGGPELRTWHPSEPGTSALSAKEDVFALLFKDLARTSRRAWSRSKKGGLRSCFGVRLERIGSFSGLGC
ncbi:natriuretic peptide A-like [Brachionichthys hirsutus]|uniref:natriuretic peptide A-like n=1 Tax=Brachionichthys hirsutus TaxID=412623 RepID=UPI0036051051